MTRLEKELAGLATMSPVQLRERWAAGGADVAPAIPASLLRRLLAQRLQEKRHGGLPLLVARELERVAATAGSPVVAQPQPKVSLTAGTRLIREWNGQTIAVEVTDAGFGGMIGHGVRSPRSPVWSPARTGRDLASSG